MLPLDTCSSPHVPRPQSGHRQLPWQEPYTRTDRYRVLAWTCSCKAMVYELCQAGGQAFIRRTLQKEPVPVIHETDRRRLKEAQEVWLALLMGSAR